MKQSDLNHLRRLLGWIRCDIGQSPAELQQTLIDVADGLGHPEISEEAKARMVEAYRRAEAVPLYVREAVKALEKALASPKHGGGAEKTSATAEIRTSIGFDPGAGCGPGRALCETRQITGGAKAESQKAQKMAMNVDDIGLDTRIIRMLRRHGIRRVSELLDCGFLGLLRIPDLGRKSLRQIEDALKRQGLALAAPDATQAIKKVEERQQ